MNGCDDLISLRKSHDSKQVNEYESDFDHAEKES